MANRKNLLSTITTQTEHWNQGTTTADVTGETEKTIVYRMVGSCLLKALIKNIALTNMIHTDLHVRYLPPFN
jgi:hypothetical protein